jgi:hypothetical protein
MDHLSYGKCYKHKLSKKNTLTAEITQEKSMGKQRCHSLEKILGIS